MQTPSIDQAAKLQFQDNFIAMAQQKRSRLENSGVVKFCPPDGKTTNIGRVGKIELAEVNTRNPDKQYGDYSLDNRMFSKRRFTRTVCIDALQDINELIKDPTSDILEALVYAKNRSIDRVIAAAASGAVLCGNPDEAPSSVTAANDGVITISATDGLTYPVVQQVTQKFINNDLTMEEIAGSVLCITGKENTDLMQEPQFINNDYISGKPVDAGKMESAGIYRVIQFAGSENGGISVSSPVLAESTTTRSCLVLAPQSIAVQLQIGRMEVERNTTKVNSWDITIDLWINAMRIQGEKVIILTTTM